MSQPAAKRRRTSRGPEPPNDRTEHSQSAPATPRRASYLSPTKASLQRSHPHLADRGTELLKHVMRDSATVDNRQQVGSEIAENLEAPKEIDKPLQTVLEETVRQPTVLKEKPVSHFEQSLRTASQDRPDRNGFAFTKVPRLVSSSHSRRRELSLTPDDSLPPTPVQLGISAPPDPPRGLSSSSPRGSRSGSGRNRLRQRDGRSVTSSPLKPKSHNIQRNRIVREKTDWAEEAQESDVGVPEPVDSDDLPEQLREKHAILQKLKAQTSQLLAKSHQLEKAMRSNDIVQAIKSDPSFIALLKSAGNATTVHDSTFNLNPADITEGKQQRNLNLFAPSSLHLEFETVTKLINQRAKVIHYVKLSAPRPWLPHTFSTEFEILTDAEGIRVEKISYTNAKPTEGMSTELHSWIEDRLADDLVRTNLDGLVWGIGNHFTASIERAKVFYKLTSKYGDSPTEDIVADEVSTPTPFLKPGEVQLLSAEQATYLSEYMNDTQLELHLPQPHVDTADNDDKGLGARATSTTQVPRLKILLIWTIALSSTSTASSKCDVVLSGASDTAQQAARDVFNRLARVEGYERAFEGVWELLSSAVVDDELADGRSPRKASGVGGKARRKRKNFA